VKLKRIKFRDNNHFIFFIKLTSAGLADSAYLPSSLVRERIVTIRRRGMRAEGRSVSKGREGREGKANRRVRLERTERREWEGKMRGKAREGKGGRTE
jgi:hypothetical protein